MKHFVVIVSVPRLFFLAFFCEGSSSAPFPRTEAAIYNGGDAELSAIFRRLSKKDSRTKNKALQSLCEIIPTRDINTISEAIHHWGYCLEKLYTDPERQVRKGAALVIEQMVSFVIVKKNRNRIVIADFSSIEREKSYTKVYSTSFFFLQVLFSFFVVHQESSNKFEYNLFHFLILYPFFFPVRHNY